jgi:phenylacetate-coenzyme A ligase PaaK-like adenylate-forming protein
MSDIFFNSQDQLHRGGSLPRFRVLAAALLIVGPMVAQSPGTQGPPATPHLQILDPSSNFGDVSMQERQVKMLNDQRQKAIVADTDKILQLARELNADAVSENPTFSPAQRMQKAEEIEKLAKNVREKMTNAIGVPPPANPYTPWQAPR